MKSSTETEVKISLRDREAIEKRLEEQGFRVSGARQFEANGVFDTADKMLRREHVILRLRQWGDSAVITWKGPGQPGPYKSRTELETSIGSLETMQKILEQLGYSLAFRYEKFRSEYSDGSHQGVVTVDETPIGDFLEIEGPGDWIDTTAVRLGFTRDDYVTQSYGGLYLAYCEKHGLEPRNMVFTSQKE